MARTILLADDSKTIQRAVEIVFEKEPYDVVCVGNGDEAVHQAKAIGADIVLADHLMPGRSGYDVAAALRDDPATQNIPVVLLTGSASPFDEAKSQASGVAATIKKPFDCQSLINQVGELLGSAGAESASAMPAFTGRPPTGAVPASATPPVQPVAPAVASVPTAPTTPGFGAPAAAPVAPAAPAGAPPSGAAAATLVPQATVPVATPEPAVAAAVVEQATAAVTETVSAAAPATEGGPVNTAALTEATREMIERVVWEVVPELAETLIKEEIARLMRDRG